MSEQESMMQPRQALFFHMQAMKIMHVRVIVLLHSSRVEVSMHACMPLFLETDECSSSFPWKKEDKALEISPSNILRPWPSYVGQVPITPKKIQRVPLFFQLFESLVLLTNGRRLLFWQRIIAPLEILSQYKDVNAAEKNKILE